MSYIPCTFRYFVLVCLSKWQLILSHRMFDVLIYPLKFDFDTAHDCSRMLPSVPSFYFRLNY